MRAKFNVEANPRIRSLRKLLELDDRDLRAIAHGVDVQFTRNERSLFASEGQSGGERWPALSPEYAKQKRKRFPGRKLMVATGKLRRSLTGMNAPGHVRVWTLKPTASVSVGTSNVLAAYHGPPNALRPVPGKVRDVLAHTDRQIQGYYDIVRREFAQKVERVSRVLKASFPRRAAGGGSGVA